MITPLGNNVIAKIAEVTKITKSGIYLSDTAANQLAPKEAEILGIGESVTTVKVGDTVVFKPYATYEVCIKEDDKTVDYIMLEEDDILGIVN